MTGNTVQLFSNVFPLHVANCTSHCGGAGPPYCTKGLKRNKYHRLFLSEHPGPRSRPLRIGKAFRDQVKRRSTFLPTGCNDLPILFILEIRWGAGPISTIRYANLRRNRRLDPGTSRPDTEKELLQAAADLSRGISFPRSYWHWRHTNSDAQVRPQTVSWSEDRKG